MNELAHLTFLRKHYSELLKLFFYEIEKGKQLSELTGLQAEVERIRLEIQGIEKELNIDRED
jgi:hypothetical protein